jgi:DNA-binding transcriptional regulator GbsR (MarR family)
MFGVLLMSEGSRSLDELAEQLEVSKASISVNARLLEQRGVVERASKQGDRRDYYRIANDILERTLEQRIGKIRRFQEALALARTHCAAGKPAVRDRLQHMDEAYRYLLEVTTRALHELHDPNGHASKRSTPSPLKSR